MLPEWLNRYFRECEEELRLTQEFFAKLEAGHVGVPKDKL